MRDELLLSLFGSEARLADPHLQPLVQRLQKADDPSTIVQWIKCLDPQIITYLEGLGGETQIRYEALLQFRNLRGGRRLIQYCLDAEVIDRATIGREKLENAIHESAARLPHHMGLVLLQYWRFELGPKLDACRSACHRSDAFFKNDRRGIVCIGDFLNYLALKGIRPESLAQPEVNSYFLERPMHYRRMISPFLTWLSRSVSRRALTCPKETRAPHREAALENYLAVLRRVRTDTDIPLLIRVALLLVLLGLRELKAIVELTKQSVVQLGEDRIELHFAQGVPLPLAGDDARLVLELRASSQHWLFPSYMYRGRRMDVRTLAVLFKKFGVTERVDELRIAGIRQYALLHGSGELARVLGLEKTTVARWRDRIGDQTRSTKFRVANAGRKRPRRIGWAAG